MTSCGWFWELLVLKITVEATFWVEDRSWRSCDTESYHQTQSFFLWVWCLWWKPGFSESVSLAEISSSSMQGREVILWKTFNLTVGWIAFKQQYFPKLGGHIFTHQLVTWKLNQEIEWLFQSHSGFVPFVLLRRFAQFRPLFICYHGWKTDVGY